MKVQLNPFARFFRRSDASIRLLTDDEMANTWGAGVDDPPAPGPAPAAEPQTFSLEYVKELREENARWRRKASDAETRATKAEAEATEKISKAEKDAGDKVSAADKAANDKLLRAELKALAIKAGIVDVDALSLADLTKLKFDDKGAVVGADALIDDLKKSKPYLFGKPATSHTETTPPKPGDTVPKKASEMTPEERKQARADISRGVLPAYVPET